MLVCNCLRLGRFCLLPCTEEAPQDILSHRNLKGFNALPYKRGTPSTVPPLKELPRVSRGEQGCRTGNDPHSTGRNGLFRNRSTLKNLFGHSPATSYHARLCRRVIDLSGRRMESQHCRSWTRWSLSHQLVNMPWCPSKVLRHVSPDRCWSSIMLFGWPFFLLQIGRTSWCNASHESGRESRPHSKQSRKTESVFFFSSAILLLGRLKGAISRYAGSKGYKSFDCPRRRS